MTAQVTAIPGDTEVLESGSAIVVEPGVRYQISDLDSATGSAGRVLTRSDLVLGVDEPAPGDLTVLLPDGTVLVFVGMVSLFEQGSGLADASGDVFVAGPEDLVVAVVPGDDAAPDGTEPSDSNATPDSDDTQDADGDAGGHGEEGDGSLAAFNGRIIGDANDFGLGPRNGFRSGDDATGEDDSTDPNEFLAASMDDEGLDTDIPLRVIDPVDPTPPVTPPVPKPGCPVCARPSITWWNEIPSDASQEVLAGTSRGDLFVVRFADLQTTLTLADVITGFEDGADQIDLQLHGAGPVTLNFTEQSVAGVGTAAADTVISVQGSGEIVAILQDVNAAGGATIDNNDITIAA